MRAVVPAFAADCPERYFVLPPHAERLTHSNFTGEIHGAFNTSNDSPWAFPLGMDIINLNIRRRHEI